MKIGFIGGKFLPLHLGHVNAIIQASKLCDKLYVVLSHSKKRDKKLCEELGRIKYISHKIRLSWLKQLVKEMSNVEVFAIEDNFAIEDYNWEEGAVKIKENISEKIDIVFSSQKNYSKIFKKLYPNSEHIIIDHARNFYNISATQIRKEGPFKHWDMIPNIVRPFFVKKVVIVGTESCGKSRLVNDLSNLFNTNSVKEYGREICDELGGSEEVLLEEIYPIIAYKQKIIEYEARKISNKILIVDTESLVTNYYYELYNNKKSNLFGEISKFQDYDLWLYLEPDVIWVDDGLRKHGTKKIREKNSFKLKAILKNNDVDFISITGNYFERFEKSKLLIQKILEEN